MCVCVRTCALVLLYQLKLYGNFKIHNQLKYKKKLQLCLENLSLSFTKSPVPMHTKEFELLFHAHKHTFTHTLTTLKLHTEEQDK